MRARVLDSVLGGRDEAETFALARRLGFAGVEVNLSREDLRAPGEQRLKRLRQAVERTGVGVPSLVLGEHNRGGLGHADPAVARAAGDDVRGAVVWARELGADVVLVPFVLEGELLDDAGIERVAAAFRSLSPLAESAGVSLCYEGLLSAAGIRALADRVSSRAFGCYFDLANPLSRDLDPGTEIRALDGLIRRVHLKDSRVGRGDCPPGLGRVDFADCALALAEIGYDGWLVLETPAAPPELVARDLSFARSHFPALDAPRRWPRFGAFSYEFGRGEWDRLAATFRGYGLETVQLGRALLDECLDRPEQAQALARGLADQGVEVAALAGYRNLIAPDLVRRESNLDYLGRCLELAPQLGTSVVATETGTRSPEGD